MLPQTWSCCKALEAPLSQSIRIPQWWVKAKSCYHLVHRMWCWVRSHQLPLSHRYSQSWSLLRIVWNRSRGSSLHSSFLIYGTYIKYSYSQIYTYRNRQWKLFLGALWEFDRSKLSFSRVAYFVFENLVFQHHQFGNQLPVFFLMLHERLLHGVNDFFSAIDFIIFPG